MTQVAKTTGPEQTENPFKKDAPAHLNAGTVEVESSRAIAEVQGKLVIAKKFPRDEATAMSNMLDSCSRLSFAQQANYSFPRAGSVITGPSIRMAEELARNWGNIDFGTKELSRKSGQSEMQAYAWDLQTNLIRTINFTVEHFRDTKKGKVALTDERDIYEVTANMAGRRVRTCLLAILPPDFVDAAVQACGKTLAAAASSGGVDRIKNMLVLFEKIKVTAKMIEERLAKKVDKINAEDMVDLASIFNSIKDNHTNVSDWFTEEDIKTSAPTLAAISEKEKAKGEKKEASPAKEDKKETPPEIPTANPTPEEPII